MDIPVCPPQAKTIASHVLETVSLHPRKIVVSSIRGALKETTPGCPVAIPATKTPMRFGLGLLLLTVPAVWPQQYVISTVAGGAPPPTPIAAVNASIAGPGGVATDLAGNVYFTSLNCVFKLDPNGVLTRVAGNSRAGYSGDGGPATSAQLTDPSGVALDASGNLYIADASNNRVRKVSAAGVITTVAGSDSFGFSGDGGPATSAQLDGPCAVAVDAGGNLYVADTDNNRVRESVRSGHHHYRRGQWLLGYSGDGGPAPSAQLSQPSGVAVDASGNLYIADTNNP